MKNTLVVGMVLFSKEQVEAQQMDTQMIIGIGVWKMMICFGDVFLKDNADDSYMKYTNKEQKYFNFDGKSSYIEIPYTRSLRHLTSKCHTVSVLVSISTRRKSSYLVSRRY